METILLYTTDQNKKRQITALLQELKIALKEITYADLKKPLATVVLPASGNGGKTDIAVPALPGASGTVTIPPMYVQPELLIMHGFSSDRMDEFLAAYKKRGIAPISLKAVVTPRNLTWSVYDLTQELSREHEAFTKRP